MKGNPIIYKNFTVYPEYCEMSAVDLMRESERDDNFHIAAIPSVGKVVGIVLRHGKIIWSRAKYNLTNEEIKAGLVAGISSPRPTELGGKDVLILICYEILFPHDYLFLRKNGTPDDQIDLIVHMIGFPMYDENQREGWIAMQDTLSIIYRCPLVCCCGGLTPYDRMNISRIIDR